ncbi:MAG: undecaprenyl-diphosphate phosphatase [Bacilli bacterium]|nr:undecaprenyl-diphosphate phosphatase [Bacilli bacterium]
MEILKVIIYGIIEGITEWLPVSSTGHLIIVERFLKFNYSADFLDMFRVVIQLGAILAVIVLYFKKLWPFTLKEKGLIKKDTLMMWIKIAVACIPAAVVGVFFDEFFEKLFYNDLSVAIALILVGLIFIIIENKKPKTKIDSIAEISFQSAIIIGICQLIAAIFPGVSRSGSTIIGALVLGISRTVAAEFTFFMAVPVMLGASLLKVLKFGLVFTQSEIIALIIGLIVSFVTSLLVIKFLMSYIKKHDFKVFGYYRIILGIIVILLMIFGL